MFLNVGPYQRAAMTQLDVGLGCILAGPSEALSQFRHHKAGTNQYYIAVPIGENQIIKTRDNYSLAGTPNE